MSSTNVTAKSPEPWTDAAAAVIHLCESWAVGATSSANFHFYLFGSAIYRGGEQFNSLESDIDIVCEFPSNGDALGRAKQMICLRSAKQHLEMKVLSELHRTSCAEPAASFVAATPLEIGANVHKSASRSFFDRNIFYDLLAKKQAFGLTSAGTHVMRDDGLRQALEYVQRIRNDYLAVCANATGGLREFSGTDPMPKALLRSAAQVAPGAADGEWYDTRRGLEELDALLRARRTEEPAWNSLYDKVSVRRGDRGLRRSLTAEDQLLLAEMLYDRVLDAAKPEPLVNWGIRVKGLTSREQFSEAVQRMLPDAKVIGPSPGGDVLTIRSTEIG